MKKDLTTFTRYVFILIIFFLAWLFLLHKLRHDETFMTFFGGSKSSTLIIQKR